MSRVPHLTDSPEIATPPKFTRSRNSNSVVRIQIKPKSQSEFLPRDTKNSEFLDLVDIWDVTFSVETDTRGTRLIHMWHMMSS